LVPGYLLRFVVWMASRFIYRSKVQGDDNLHRQRCRHPDRQ
jgi:hypothetical protein